MQVSKDLDSEQAKNIFDACDKVIKVKSVGRIKMKTLSLHLAVLGN